jgi:hypothetical protein
VGSVLVAADDEAVVAAGGLPLGPAETSAVAELGTSGETADGAALAMATTPASDTDAVVSVAGRALGAEAVTRAVAGRATVSPWLDAPDGASRRSEPDLRSAKTPAPMTTTATANATKTHLGRRRMGSENGSSSATAVVTVGDPVPAAGKPTAGLVDDGGDCRCSGRFSLGWAAATLAWTGSG